jgi:N-ethylmaleimide reductase
MSGTTLFTSIQIGALTLPNRIVMAPLTRGRAVDGRIPNDLMAKYYRQRATAGLIISEATQISELSLGYANTPGIHTPAQVEGWKKVTQAVHEAGGRIFLQLWHVGRAAHPAYMNGAQPVAPSAVPIPGEAHTPEGKIPYATPRALTKPEIAEIVDQYREGASKAKAAGFDGVEIHAANGYLIDEFLRTEANRRTDEYGGSVENRARFLLEVAQAVVGVWGGDRVGVRLSPTNAFNGMNDANPRETFTYAARQLNRFDLAYLHVLESLPNHFLTRTHEEFITPHIRAAYAGNLIVNAGYDKQLGNDAIARGAADLVAYGSLYISNPDLVERFRNDWPLSKPDIATYYTPGETGYADYPTYAETQATQIGAPAGR